MAKLTLQRIEYIGKRCKCPPLFWTVSKIMKSPYIPSNKMPFTWKYLILYDAQCNPHKINTLHLAFKNMLFMLVEHVLLGARRASSSTLSVMRWYVVGYRLGGVRCYTPILKVFSLMLCNDFSQVYWLVQRMKWDVWNILWNVSWSLLLTLFLYLCQA